MQNSAIERRAAHEEFEKDKQKAGIYLSMIAEAIKLHSNNNGTIRKLIWQYLLDTYKKKIDYADFLRAIQTLLSEGKLKNLLDDRGNKTGVYAVEPNTFKELMQKWKKSSPLRSISNNPLLSEKARAKSICNPFASAVNSTSYNRHTLVGDLFKAPARRAGNKKISPERKLEKEEGSRQTSLEKYYKMRENSPKGQSKAEVIKEFNMDVQ